MELRTGSNLIDQFQGHYVPRVFNMTLPWLVGGPDIRGRERFRRCADNAPAVTLDMFTQMLPRRVEAQIRWDWDLVPAVWSLAFSTKVNTGATLSIKRILRPGAMEEGDHTDEKSIGEAAAQIYRVLWAGDI